MGPEERCPKRSGPDFVAVTQSARSWRRRTTWRLPIDQLVIGQTGLVLLPNTETVWPCSWPRL